MSTDYDQSLADIIKQQRKSKQSGSSKGKGSVRGRGGTQRGRGRGRIQNQVRRQLQTQQPSKLASQRGGLKKRGTRGGGPRGRKNTSQGTPQQPSLNTQRGRSRKNLQGLLTQKNQEKGKTKQGGVNTKLYASRQSADVSKAVLSTRGAGVAKRGRGMARNMAAGLKTQSSASFQTSPKPVASSFTSPSLRVSIGGGYKRQVDTNPVGVDIVDMVVHSTKTTLNNRFDEDPSQSSSTVTPGGRRLKIVTQGSSSQRGRPGRGRGRGTGRM